MSRFRNIEALRNFIPVYEKAEQTDLQDCTEALRLVRMAYLELEYYFKELMFDESYFVELILPHEEFKICTFYEDFVDEEYITLPFGTFTSNVWNKLLADENNPLFQLLEYFEFHTRLLHNLVGMYGVGNEQFITYDVLQKYQIEDMYSLHTYVGIYDEYWKFIGKNEK